MPVKRSGSSSTPARTSRASRARTTPYGIAISATKTKNIRPIEKEYSALFGSTPKKVSTGRVSLPFHENTEIQSHQGLTTSQPDCNDDTSMYCLIPVRHKQSTAPPTAEPAEQSAEQSAEQRFESMLLKMPRSSLPPTKLEIWQGIMARRTTNGNTSDFELSSKSSQYGDHGQGVTLSGLESRFIPGTNGTCEYFGSPAFGEKAGEVLAQRQSDDLCKARERAEATSNTDLGDSLRKAFKTKPEPRTSFSLQNITGSHAKAIAPFLESLLPSCGTKAFTNTVKVKFGSTGMESTSHKQLGGFDKFDHKDDSAIFLENNPPTSLAKSAARAPTGSQKVGHLVFFSDGDSKSKSRVTVFTNVIMDPEEGGDEISLIPPRGDNFCKWKPSSSLAIKNVPGTDSKVYLWEKEDTSQPPQSEVPESAAECEDEEMAENSTGSELSDPPSDVEEMVLD